MSTEKSKSKEELDLEAQMDKMVEEAFKPIYEGYEPYPAYVDERKYPDIDKK